MSGPRAEHAASEVSVGPHSRALLFGVGPNGLDLPPVESSLGPRSYDHLGAQLEPDRRQRRQRKVGAAGVGARAGPGRAPLAVGGAGDSDLEEWSDDDD